MCGSKKRPNASGRSKSAAAWIWSRNLMRHIPDYSLWLGHAGDARDKHELMRLGITAVVDLAIEEPPAVAGHEMVYCRFPLIDGTENPPWLLRAAIDMTATLLRQKGADVDLLRRRRESFTGDRGGGAGQAGPAVVARRVAVSRRLRPLRRLGGTPSRCRP